MYDVVRHDHVAHAAQGQARYFAKTTWDVGTGDARLKHDEATATTVGRTSPFGLYREDLATFGADDVYRQADAEGFIRLFGLGQKVAAMRDRLAQQGEVEVSR